PKYREEEQSGRSFNNSKWDCCNDCNTFGHCLLASWCAPCYAGYLFSKAGSSFCTGFCHVSPLVTLRSYYRGVNAIQGTLCEDCCFSIFCYPCAATQLHNDMDASGY
ncbi:hypothetical protein Ciccas_014601, partial [Cichlidogyrus casuarinus]